MKEKKYNILSLILMFVIGAAAACIVCVLLFPLRFGSMETYLAAGKFATVYNVIEEFYVGEPDMELGSDVSYDALVAYSTDEWSYYMDAEGYEAYKEFQANSYSGVGITAKPDEESGYLRVYSVAEDTPAKNAGVQPGDLIVALGGEDVAGLTVSDLRDLIAEAQGEEFSMTLRAQDGSERAVSMKAEQIYSEPVEYSLLDGGVGYIKIKNFEQRGGSQTVAAVDDLIAQGAVALVFDLRDNPGGMLSELLTALDRLLPEGDMFIARDKSGDEEVTVSDAVSCNLPMAVLIDEDTYSAAEFFAAALSEYKLAVLVGEHTTGKSHSQETIPLTDGSAVHISTMAYLTPEGVDLAEQGGLSPDVEVSLSEEEQIALIGGELMPENDPQLAAAIEAFK